MNLDRNRVISMAINDCLRELYAKAQPSVNIDNLKEDLDNGNITDNFVYCYYISREEFDYIVDKYMDAYNMNPYWKDCADLMLDYVKGIDSYKDVWVKDKDGSTHRDYEKVQPLYNFIGKTNFDLVIKYLTDCKNWYKFDNESSTFKFNVFNWGPSTNKEKVIAYWKSKGVDLQIEDRDPDTLWYRDEYGDKWEEMYKEDCEIKIDNVNYVKSIDDLKIN